MYLQHTFVNPDLNLFPCYPNPVDHLLLLISNEEMHKVELNRTTKEKQKFKGVLGFCQVEKSGTRK